MLLDVPGSFVRHISQSKASTVCNTRKPGYQNMPKSRLDSAQIITFTRGLF
jgi:hypothetical protein